MAKKTRDFGNVISPAGFAQKKGVSRQNVNTWIASGRIETVLVGDRPMIDMDKYEDFNPEEIPKGPPVTIEGLGRRVKALENSFRELEGLVNRYAINS